MSSQSLLPTLDEVKLSPSFGVRSHKGCGPVSANGNTNDFVIIVVRVCVIDDCFREALLCPILLKYI